MDNFVSKYKLKKFIDTLIIGKLLTEEHVSHCSKSIFEFIRNNKELQEIFKGMTLSERSENNIVKEYWINLSGKRLSIDNLLFLI